MSGQLTPSKRSHEGNQSESNGRGKLQKSAPFGSQNSSSSSSSSGGTLLRVLCPSNKIGSVIGKGGSVISQIRQESNARIRVEDSVPGCEERIIFITSPDRESEDGTEEQQQPIEKEDDNADDVLPKTDEGIADNEDKEHSAAVEDTQPENEQAKEREKEKEKDRASSVQKALLLVFQKMVEGEPEKEKDAEGDEEGDKSSSCVVRLLVFSNQIGCLLGKAGSVIKQMSYESGAQIRILPKDKLLAPASPNDELVQISGAVDSVKKALISVSQQLLEHVPRDQKFSANSGGSSSHAVGRPPSRQDSYAQQQHPFHGDGMPYSAGFHDGDAARMHPAQDVLTFRLWCPHDKIGGVIGKGGTVVRAIQNETGCEIKVLDGGPDSEDRIIVISGPAHPEDRISPAQDAVLRVQARIFRASPEHQDKNLIAKLLVSSNQIGCLIGKGGSIIAEMRKSTGAYIRILGKDQLPKGASENEEVVQMNGEQEIVQEALLQITARLRDHFFRDAFPSMKYPPNPAFLDHVHPFPPYIGRRDLSPSAMYPVGGRPPHGNFHPHDERPPFVPNFHRQGMPPHMSDRMPSSAVWGPQGQIDGAGPLGLPDYTGVPQRRMSGFGGANPPAIITSTKIEVVVPRSVVPAIYGEDGGCLRQIREISDAKVTITDSKPGATETLIIISGTPEQTNAAQSLIQAFVISETEAT